MVNLEKQKINRISLYQYELSNKDEVRYNLILYQNKIISNFKHKIIIFNNNSIKRTLLAYIKAIKDKIILSLVIFLLLSLIIFCIFSVCFLSFTFILTIFGYDYYYKKYFEKVDIFIEEYDGGRLKKYYCLINTFLIIVPTLMKLRH